jgi:ankyrin repeat protein
VRDIKKYVHTDSQEPQDPAHPEPSAQVLTEVAVSKNSRTSTSAQEKKDLPFEQRSPENIKDATQAKARVITSGAGDPNNEQPNRPSLSSTSDVHKIIKYEYRASPINTQTEDGETPLFVACQQGHAAVVKKLLEYKDFVDVNLYDNNKRTPLFVACEQGHIEVIHALLGFKNTDVNLPDNEGRTPFYVAFEQGHMEVVNTLLTFEADFTIVSSNGKTAFVAALENNPTDVGKILLRENVRDCCCVVIYCVNFKISNE